MIEGEESEIKDDQRWLVKLSLWLLWSLDLTSGMDLLSSLIPLLSPFIIFNSTFVTFYNPLIPLSSWLPSSHHCFYYIFLSRLSPFLPTFLLFCIILQKTIVYLILHITVYITRISRTSFIEKNSTQIFDCCFYTLKGHGI